MARINIICGDEGWIYAKFVAAFRQYSKNQILLNSKEKCDLTYCLPYYEFNDSIRQPSVIFLSHQERRKDLYDKFIDSAKKATIGISMSKKYKDLLALQGITNVVQIVPGIDLEKFKLRSSDKKLRQKLVVGYVGRQYTSSDRKNKKLLDRISNLPFVEFRVTGGMVDEVNLPKFYSELDIVVSPAIIEGGPMAIIESAAVGVPFMCFDGVGLANEFLYGIIKIPFGDEDAFINRLEEFWRLREYLIFNKLENMKAARSQVEKLTQENFVKGHDNVWENLIIK